MMKVLNRTEAAVNFSALKHNFNEIKRITSDADIIAVIKANAYGHGACEVAHLFEELGASILAVACLDEALELRVGGIKMPIMILGITPIHLAGLLADNNIIQSVSNFDYANDLSSVAEKMNKNITVHIQFDTGMSRLGIYAHKGFELTAADEAEKITNLKNISVDGLFTHFAEAENTDTSFTDEQFESFIEVCDILKSRRKMFRFCHCANSAAVVNYKRAHLSCVRPGLLLYGYSPMAERNPDISLLPAMTFKSLIADVRTILKGDSVSYNRKFIAPRDMKIAVVSCGYADGLSRHLSNCGSVLIGGRRAPILGNVCMDLLLADVTDIPDVKPFDEAVIFGQQNHEVLLADEIASLSGTIPYEVLTSVSKRVLRTYRR